MNHQEQQHDLTGFRKITLKHAPYSASKLIIARCPSRFQGKYILKDVTVGDSLNAAKGSAIHHILEQISKAHVVGQAIVPQKINSWTSEGIGMFPASYAMSDLIKDAATAYAGNKSPYLNETTKCEMQFAVEFYEEESLMDDYVPQRKFTPTWYVSEEGKYNRGAFFGAKIDQISFDEQIKTITILDHKSTPTSSTNADFSFQLGSYAWVVSKFYPGWAIRTVLHYAHPALNFYAPPEYWSPEDLQEIEDELLTRIGAIENFSEFPALPGSGCDYCHMVQECDVYRKLEEQKNRGGISMANNTVDDLIKLAKQVRVTGVLYDQLNQALKDGIETNCPQNGIAIEGMWYGFKVGDRKVDWDATETKIKEESERAKELLLDPNLDSAKKAELESIADYEDLDGFLEKCGLVKDVFKKWDTEKLKALGKHNPNFMMKIKNFLVFDRGTRFSGYKI